MSTFIGDVCVSTGEYTDQQGQNKKRWTKVGAAFSNDNGQVSFKLDVLPMPKENGCWLSVFEKQEQPKQNFQQAQPQQYPGAVNMQPQQPQQPGIPF